MNEIHKTSNPGSGRRQRKRQAKTRVLLDVAFSLVVDTGLDGLTMPALAARADVAVGGLYQYFSGKRGLIVALQVDAIHALDGWVAERVSELGVSGVRGIVVAVADFAATHPTRFELLEAAVSDPRRLLDDGERSTVDEALAPLLGRVGACLRVAVETDELAAGDPEQRTLVLWALVFGSLHHRKRDRDRPSAHASRSVLLAGVDAVLRGWR